MFCGMNAGEDDVSGVDRWSDLAELGLDPMA